MHVRRTKILPQILCGIISLAVNADCLQAANPYSYGTDQAANRAMTPAMQYFGRGLAPTTPARNFSRQMPTPQPLQVQGTKPFETLRRPPTISPYLGLDVRESELGLPNYYAFVRPAQQQQIAAREQAEHIRNLKQKLRVATARGIVSNNPSGGVPTTGHSSQFLNLGGYFSDVR
ncbi:MAG: hypothetical protein KDA57_15375 [Planctomycetales bacterium]|nr:hypothetical protein [Planctomycetales bacterium]